MNGEPSSPKRRHILSSINPDDITSKRSRRPSPEKAASLKEPSPLPPDAQKRKDEGEANTEDTTKPRRSRLKLKSERRRHRSRDRRERESSHRHHRHHRSHRRRHRSATPPNPYDAPSLDPDAAFRESLFDAMADDEGASYWEGVYGQPIHGYSDQRVGPQGELEKMTDEEYAAHVRQKMWEKTHAGLLEERERREAERKRRKEEERESRRIDEEMEKSLRRGEERRKRRRWADRWEAYTAAWADWDGSPGKIAWPVEKGQRENLSATDVRDFFILGLDLRSIGEKEFIAKLKDERVRWHPDKIQQRLGGQVDAEVMKDVTAIFQIVDRLWNEMRKKE